jgi:hypothetical protein
MKLRRKTVKTIVFLVTGAIINVAVAWVCVLIAARTFRTIDVPSDDERAALHRRHAVRESIITTDGWGVNFTYGDARRTFFGVVQFKVGATDREPLLIHEARAGYPCHGLASSRLTRLEEQSSEAVEQFYDSYSTRSVSTNDFAMPTGPIWPGFAINTIFYAAILWLLSAAPFALRRRRRIKRGQCASCGYSLRDSTSDKCPECGATK